MLGAFDLTCDPDEVLGLGVEDLVAAMTGRDRSIHIVYANKMPAVVELDLVPDLNSAFGVPAETIHQRAQKIASDGDFKERVGRALAQRFPPWEAAEIVEKRIYEAFPSSADNERISAFHTAPWAERAELVEAFEDERLRELGRRLVFLEKPNALAPEQRELLDEWLHNRKHGREDVEAGRTIPDALAEIEELKEQQPEAEPAIKNIEGWLRTI